MECRLTPEQYLDAHRRVEAGERRPENRKPYKWCVSRRRDVAYLLKSLLPYLRVKREVALRALAEEGV